MPALQTELSAIQLAERWGRSRITIYDMHHRGRLPKPCQTEPLRWSLEDIEEYERAGERESQSRQRDKGNSAEAWHRAHLHRLANDPCYEHLFHKVEALWGLMRKRDAVIDCIVEHLHSKSDGAGFGGFENE